MPSASSDPSYWTDTRRRIKEYLSSDSETVANAYVTMIELLNAVEVPSRAELVAHLGRDIMNALGERTTRFKWQEELMMLAKLWEPHRHTFSLFSAGLQTAADVAEIPTAVGQSTFEVLDRFDVSSVTKNAKWRAILKRHLELEENTLGTAEAAVRTYNDLQHAFVGYAHVDRDKARNWEKVSELANRLDRLLSVLASGSFFERKGRVDELLSAANRCTD